jgi:hypothetical protein
MWILKQLVAIEKARQALRAGHLDEAYALATRAELRDHRQCQALLEKLVPALLERSKRHLDAGRAEDALADVGRAQEAGGNRPEVAALRDECLKTLRALEEAKRMERRAVESVRKHFDEGQLAAGEARLDALVAAGANAGALEERLDALRDRARSAQQRLENEIAAGDLDAALATARTLLALASDKAETRELTARLSKLALERLASSFQRGELEPARRLSVKLAGLAEGAELDGWRDALDESEKAAAALARGDWSEAAVRLERLRPRVPEAEWVASSVEKLRALDSAHRELLAGPLGKWASAWSAKNLPKQGPSGEVAFHDFAETLPVPAAEPAGASAGVREDPPAPRGSERRFTLWVDGVGSFLVVLGDRITLGRSGSSARPDVELTADLEGIHAEVLRVDHDYFLVPRGEVRVDGRAVERQLLAHGDAFQMGRRCRLKFLLPTSLSTTAVLDLGSGPRLEGGIRHVVLLDGHMVFGGRQGFHVAAPSLSERVVLSATPEGFRLRGKDAVRIEGKPAGDDTVLPLGAHVEVGELSFTLKAASAEGARR